MSGGNDMNVVSVKPDIIDVKIRVVNAKNGKLRQVIFKEQDIEQSPSRTLNEILFEIAEKL
jgi:hypothetical protein